MVMDKLLVKFLFANGYFSFAGDIKLQLRSHPDFPSLKSITDTLDYFEIENLAAQVPKEALDELPDAFLALIEENKAPALVLAVKKKHKIILHFFDSPKQVVTHEAFKEKWSGTIVAVEANKQRKRKGIGVASVVLILILLLFLALQLSHFQLTAFLLALSSLAGVYLSYLIVKEETGIHSKTAATVCGAVSKTGNCAGVINAPGSTLFGFMALSDLCVTFFTGFTLIYTLTGYNSFFTLIILSLGFPVLIFSLYQQAVIIKQWCGLCLGIATILAGQGIWVATHLTAFTFSFTYTLQALFLLAVVYAVWLHVKPLLIDELKLRQTEEAFLRFKRDENLFTSLLYKEALPHNHLIKEEHRISYGAAHPVIEINAATNPLCGFCTGAFTTYDKLLHSHAGKIRINFIFNVPFEQKDNPATQIAVKWLEIYRNAPEEALEAMRNWFKMRDVEAWQRHYGITEREDEAITTLLKAHRQWCMENGITYTPATVIEGYVYPKTYATSDLMFFIDDMIGKKEEDG